MKFTTVSEDVSIETTDIKNIELFICAKWCVEPFMIQYNVYDDGIHVLLTNKLGEVFADIGTLYYI